MTVDQLKALACAEIDRRGEEAVGIAQDILVHPEPGYREERTGRVVADKLASLGVPVERDIALTGSRAMLDTGRAGPTVAVMGELDSLIVPGHPNADAATGAAHACGHHCQIGSMIAAAMGLQASGVMEALSGRVALLAVPSEEYIEIEYRDELRRAGGIEFLGGKPEFIRLGKLDDVDMAMMTHTIAAPRNAKFALGGTNNGMLSKLIAFKGTAAHAGAAPHAGVNALNAAMIAMSAIHAQRETHRDEDTIRIHPIITRGGSAVSSVPADVRMETFVRGRSVEAFTMAARKVDRASEGRGPGRRRQRHDYDAPRLHAHPQRADYARPPHGQHGGAGGRGQGRTARAPSRLHRHGRCVADHARHSPIRRRGDREGPRR